MSTFTGKLRRIGSHAEPAWSPERAATNELAVRRRLERGTARRRAAAVALGAACLVVVALVARRPRERDAMVYADGSIATPITSDARMTVAIVSRALVVSELEAGAYRFVVAHDAQRTFRIEVDEVQVEVLGTEFTVTRLTDDVRVDVVSGRVRVACRGASTELMAGQTGSFALLATPPVIRLPSAAAPERPEPPSLASASAKRSWVRLAQAGDYDAAFAALARSHRAPTGPAELMLAADAARLSHHAQEALAPLRTIVSRHPRDPRAPLAAFTLGWVLLDELGRPTEAAEAFARASTLSPQGPLAEDALAREVEAWSRASDVARALERAETYLAKYPHGTRARSVRRFGGLE